MRKSIFAVVILSFLTLNINSGSCEMMPWWEKEGEIQRNSLGQHDNWRHYYRGLKQLEAREYHQAEREFDYYLNHPELHRHMFGIAYFGRGLIRMKQGNEEEAMNEFKMALREDLHPDVKIADKVYMNIGTMNMKKKNYKEAFNAYEKAVSIDPKNGQAQYYLGLAAVRAGNIELAEKQSAEAKKLGISYVGLEEEIAELKKNPAGKSDRGTGSNKTSRKGKTRKGKSAVKEEQE